MGRQYKKAQFRRYRDASFAALQPRPAAEEHTGLLGPVLRAAVGQTLRVVLRNGLPFPVSLEALGLPASEGGGAVEPGGTLTLCIPIPASAGPSALEPTARLVLYRSTADLTKHGNAGLVGPLLIRWGGRGARGAGRGAAPCGPCAGEAPRAPVLVWRPGGLLAADPSRHRVPSPCLRACPLPPPRLRCVDGAATRRRTWKQRPT